MVIPILLLHGSETWVVKSDSLRRLESFHNSVCTGLSGVTKLLT